MKINLEFAELHAPLFHAGYNLGLKLDPKQRKDLSLVFDQETNELLVTYNGKTSHVTITSIHSYVPASLPASVQVSMAEKLKDAQKNYVAPVPLPTQPAAAFDATMAQVGSPHDHVFAGPGGGDTGQQAVPKRGK